MAIDWVKRSEDLRPQVRNFVQGHWSEGGGPLLEKRSSRDGRILTRFRSGESSDVDWAVSSARRAFDARSWVAMPAQRRRSILHTLASLIEKNSQELALLECLDVGKPISDVLNFDIPSAVALIRYNADAADTMQGKVYGVDCSSMSFQLRRPVGVVGGIIGWNFPLLLAAGKIGPVLAAGNSLVLKPSELTSLSAARLAELAVESGLPEGVFNVVHGGPHIGSTLAHHRAIDLVTFTGSSQTGKRVLVAAGQSNMKRVVLECGGKSPNIIFDDNPGLEAVAQAVVAKAFWNQGQVCTASSRVLVQNSIKDEFINTLIKKVALLKPEDPLKPETQFGAMVSESHKERVLRYIQLGLGEGARILYQSDAPSPLEGGSYVAPVVFSDVSSRHRIAQEEIFGPVLSVITFEDENEAIEIANDTIYGLSAILWTKDLGRAHRVVQGVKAGWVVVNASPKPVGGPGIGVLSVGGHKESGHGTEGGIEGLETYTSSTAVQLFV